MLIIQILNTQEFNFPTFATSSKDNEMDMENMNHILRTLQKNICIALCHYYENSKQRTIIDKLLTKNPR